MFDFFISLDHSLFLFIDHLPHPNIFNVFFAFLSGVGDFGFVWVVIAIMLFLIGELSTRRSIVELALSIGLSYVFVDMVVKQIIQRLRPQFTLQDVVVIWDTTNTYSFPSTHATVSFAAAVVLASHHKKGKWIYFFLAALIAFSRMYLGKHYPSDVLVGAIVGLCIGQISLIIVKNINKFYKI